MPFDPNKPVQPSGEERAAFNPTKAVVPFMTVEGPDTPNPFANSETPPEPDEELAPDSDPLVLNGVTLPRIESARIRAMSPEARKKWDEERHLCLTNQLFLSGVMGLDLVENPHAALFHLFLKKNPGAPLYSLDPVTKKRLVLWPRGSAKTHCVRVEEVQLILNYPNIRICFLTGGDDLAKRQLAALKRVFSQPTQRFKELFPEFCLVSKQDKRSRQWTDVSPVWGNAHEFSVPARTDDTLPEPTFAISTARSVNSGSHFEVIVIDDLVHDKNWQSAAMLEKCYQDYLSITPLLDPNGYIVMTGTRYAIGDTYERIMDNAEEIGQLSVWKFSVRNCWSTGGCRNCKHPDVFHDRITNVVQPPCTACPCLGFQSDGVNGVLFPQVMKKNGEPFGHTMEYLARQRAEQGEKFFANQYLNEPVAEGTKVFTEALIGSVTLHHESQLPSWFNAPRYLVGDLAYSTSEDRDESVIYAFSKFHGALYFWGCWAGRWAAAERVDRVLQLIKDVRPVKAYFEENLNSDSFHLNLVAMAPKYGLAQIPVDWIKTGNKKDAKNARIADIEMAMKGRRVYIYAAMQNYDRLNSQLLKWPNIKHDDLADALALGLHAPTGWQYETVPPPPELQKSWVKNYLGESAEPQADWPDTGGGTGMCCGG